MLDSIAEGAKLLIKAGVPIGEVLIILILILITFLGWRMLKSVLKVIKEMTKSIVDSIDKNSSKMELLTKHMKIMESAQKEGNFLDNEASEINFDNILDSIFMKVKRECLGLKDDFQEKLKETPNLIERHKSNLDEGLSSVFEQSYDDLTYRCAPFKNVEQGPLKDFVRSMRSEWNHLRVSIYLRIAEETTDIKAYLDGKNSMITNYFSFWVRDGLGFAERKKQNEKE